MTTRDIVVAGALPRQQVRSYLKALKLDYTERRTSAWLAYEYTFHVPGASDEQWGQIQEWVKKVTR